MSQNAVDEVRQTLKRIEEHANVAGIVIVNRAGAIIHTTLDTALTAYYAQHCGSLAGLARCTVRETDPTDDLQFFRVRTKKHEIMIAPEKDYILIVLQNAPKPTTKFA